MKDSQGKHSGPAGTQGDVLSLAEFQCLLSQYLVAVEQQLWQIRAYNEILQESHLLWPDQCQTLHTLLKGNHTTLQAFRRLLERYQMLPGEIVPRRYLPLLFLQNAELQTRRLLTLTQACSETPDLPRRERMRQRQEIDSAWQHLLHHYEETLTHGRVLSDQARFLQRRRKEQPERRDESPSSPFPLEEEPDPPARRADAEPL